MSEKQYMLTDFDSEVEMLEKINEQQATIRKLQDLCGESDYENARLRRENKKLQRKIDWLCETFDYGSDESIRKMKSIK